MMNRGTALAKLRRHAPELRAEGIVALYLFGSTARDEARKASDIDLFFDAFRCRAGRPAGRPPSEHADGRRLDPRLEHRMKAVASHDVGTPLEVRLRLAAPCSIAVATAPRRAATADEHEAEVRMAGERARDRQQGVELVRQTPCCRSTSRRIARADRAAGGTRCRHARPVGSAPRRSRRGGSARDRGRARSGALSCSGRSR